MNPTAALAHAITWRSSKQSYLTARLLVDRDKVDDFLRGYAYFRWADDQVDQDQCAGFDRFAFISRQKELIRRFYLRETPPDLCLQERLLRDVIAHDPAEDGRLRSFIENFMAIIEFDAGRKGSLVSRQELSTYTARLATAVMDGIQYFINHSSPCPPGPERTQAVTGAHLVHMLRDTLEDLPAGYINVPREILPEESLNPQDVDSPFFRLWVHQQVDTARACFRSGKRYIERQSGLRCKLAGAWYCARFEWYLDVIERDDYRLRPAYPGRKGWGMWLQMAWLGLVIFIRHFATRLARLWNSTPEGQADPRISQGA